MTTLLVLLASTITLTAPEDGAKWDTHSPCVHEFLENPDKRSNPRPPEPPLSEDEEQRKKEMDEKFKAWEEGGCQGKAPKRWDRRWNFYERNEWTEALYERSAEETATYYPFKWKADFKMPLSVVEFSETEDFKKVIAEKTTEWTDRKTKVHHEADSIRPHFLKVNTKYWWRVKAKDAEGKEIVSDVRSFTTLDAFPRILGTPACNWRDHGGGVNADGKRVRQGMIIRMNAPLNSGYPLPDEYDGGKATPETQKAFYVDILGIKSQMDLRGEGEAENAETSWGRIRLDKAGINVHFFPVDPYHLDGYTKDNYRDAIKFLSHKENYPVMYNCAAGCDRTGSIGFLIDGILNRTDKQIYDDYELPSLNPMAPRLRYCRKAVGMFGSMEPNNSDYGNHPTMAGNIVAYLLKIGVTQEEIDNIRKIMLED